MNSFERQVYSFIQQENLITTQDRLLVACSGGIDSMALLSFCITLRKLHQIPVYVVHVDHMLRGETSLQDRLFVEQFCRKHNIEYCSTSIDIPTLLQKQGGNVQALCRQQRYSFFETAVEKFQATKLLTAHHADDQLESMLMALTKSASLNGLKGISVKRAFAKIEIIRPFLMVTKDEIREYLEGEAIAYREDESNAKSTYMRNRLRHQVVPILKAENYGVSLHATQISKQLVEDDLFIQQHAEQVFKEIVRQVEPLLFEIDLERLQKIAVTLQRRIILILLNYLYNDTNTSQSYTLYNAIFRLMQGDEGSSEIHLPKGFIARRSYRLLKVGQLDTQQRLMQLTVRENELTELQDVCLYIGEISEAVQFEQATTYYFNRQQVKWPLIIRAPQKGDKMNLPNMIGAKKLTRIFIDEKIPAQQRTQWPVLIDQEQTVLALLGIRVSNIFSKNRRHDDDVVLIVSQANS